MLFDLDGCLADSHPTIAAALEDALEELGYPHPGAERLRAMVGPPFRLAFSELFGVPPESEEVERAIVAYRSRYRVTLLRTTGFEGMPEALDELARAGVRLGVATSKPRPYAEQVLDVLGLRGRFDVVEGPALDGMENKTTTVERALAQLDGVYALVGDTSFDVRAALDHGLRAVGVLWGIGSRAELEAAGADVLVSAPPELPAVLLGE